MRIQKIIILIQLFILTYLIMTCTPSRYFSKDIPTFNDILPLSSILSQQIEELNNDVLINILNPYIEKSLKNYYGESLPYDPCDAKILSIEKPYNYRTYKVILQITTYTGPHIQIGEDMITFVIEIDGKITVDQYKHLKTYDYLEQRQKKLQKEN